MSQCKIVSTDILIEFLEVIFHGILYHRKIYPIEIFEKKKIYGTAVWISEHPEVNEYLKNVLEAIREALKFESTSIKRINFVIFNEDNDFVEKFVIDLLEIKIDSTESDPYFLKTEESLRTVCLKLSMINNYLKPLPDTSKFIIELETHEAAHVNLSENAKCEDFPWILGKNENYENSVNNSLLPIYTVKTEFLGLQFFAIGRGLFKCVSRVREKRGNHWKINCRYLPLNYPIFNKKKKRDLSTKIIMGMSPGTKQKIAAVLEVTKVIFHWGFVPTILYLGFKKGADPGMPPLTAMSLLWM